MDVQKEEEEEEDEKYEFAERRRRERERERRARRRGLHDYDREAEKRSCEGRGGARLSRRGDGAKGDEARSRARMHETSVRVKVAKCALDAAHLSLPTAHRPLPARSTNWANRWTPTDLFDPALVVAHAGPRAHPFFRLPLPAFHPNLLVLSADRDRLIPESDVDVGCRNRRFQRLTCLAILALVRCGTSSINVSPERLASGMQIFSFRFHASSFLLLVARYPEIVVCRSFPRRGSLS